MNYNHQIPPHKEGFSYIYNLTIKPKTMKKITILIALFVIVSCKKEMAPEEMIAVDTIPVTVPEKEVIAKVDSQKVKELKSFFNHKSDEYSEDKTTWITPKAAAPYRNQNGAYCYFSKNNLRFVFQYHSDDWLFIKKYQFLIDNKPYEYIPDEVKRDNDETGITEWFDQSVDYSNKDIIEALAKAKKAKVKLVGDSYVDYQKITEKQLLAFKRTLEYYKALGNSF